MRRLNSIRKKHPEIKVIVLGEGISSHLAIGYVDLDKPVNEFNILTEKEYSLLEDNSNYSMVVVILGGR